MQPQAPWTPGLLKFCPKTQSPSANAFFNMQSPASLQTKDLSAPLDLRTFYFLLRDRAWIIIVCILLACIGTAAYLFRTPSIYGSKSVLQVEQEEAKILNIQKVQHEDLQGQEILKT